MNTIRVTTAWKGSGTAADPYRLELPPGEVGTAEPECCR